MKFVMKIGGSLLFDKNKELDVNRFLQYAKTIQQIIDKRHDFVIVIGGGALAKKLVEFGSELDADRSEKDWLGIAATWVCAQLMITALKESAHPTPIMTENELIKLLNGEKLLIVGGLEPGQSTNAVAARIAELTKAEVLVNVTDVEGVYDKDPKRFPEAKLLPIITVDQLRQIISSLTSEPGTYPLFDTRALDVVNRASIEVWFVDGRDPKNILRAVSKQEVGTRLIHD